MEIDKKQAIKRLEAIEKETEELKKIINKTDDWTSIIDFESALKHLKREVNISKLRSYLSESQINEFMLETCIEAINTENGKRWLPDFNNSNQYKWYNYFEKKGSGWLFVCLHFCGVYSSVGFGFYYETEEKAKYGSKYFKQYYDIWLGK